MTVIKNVAFESYDEFVQLVEQEKKAQAQDDENVVISGCQFYGLTISHKEIINYLFIDCSFVRSTKFISCVIRDTKFSRCLFEDTEDDANFYDTRLEGVCFKSCKGYIGMEKVYTDSIELFGCELNSLYISTSYMNTPYVKNSKINEFILYNTYVSSGHMNKCDVEIMKTKWSSIINGSFNENTFKYFITNNSSITCIDISYNNNKILKKSIKDSFGITSIVPEESSFIAYKKVKYYNPNEDEYSTVILKLLIPEDAKRSNATGRKCRASKVIVLDAYDKYKNRIELCEKDKLTSSYDESFEYKINETIEPDSFDDNKWDECSHGIHFFMTFDEAANY